MKVLLLISNILEMLPFCLSLSSLFGISQSFCDGGSDGEYFLINALFGRNRPLLMPPTTHSGFITFIVCREPSITPESVWNPPLLTAPHLMAAVLAAGHFFIRWNCLLAAGSGRGHLPPPLRRGRTKINPTNNQEKRVSMETRLFWRWGRD